MTVKWTDLGTGDQALVTFAGTIEPDHFTVAGSDQWGFTLARECLSVAAAIERVTPALIAGHLYQDTQGRLWEAQDDDETGMVIVCIHGPQDALWTFEETRGPGLRDEYFRALPDGLRPVKVVPA